MNNKKELRVEDQPRSGRPRTAVTEAMTGVLRAIAEEDLHLSYQQIQHILGISSASLNWIIADHLNLSKVGARWVQHWLIDLRSIGRFHSAVGLRSSRGRWSMVFQSRFKRANNNQPFVFQGTSRLQRMFDKVKALEIRRWHFSSLSGVWSNQLS